MINSIDFRGSWPNENVISRQRFSSLNIENEVILLSYTNNSSKVSFLTIPYKMFHTAAILVFMQSRHFSLFMIPLMRSDDLIRGKSMFILLILIGISRNQQSFQLNYAKNFNMLFGTQDFHYYYWCVCVIP